ncbi:MAG: hypothetical protein AAF577_04825 [Pseudomonadota bacterium]
MRIEEETARRLILRFDPGKGRTIALGLGIGLMVIGLGVMIALGATPEGRSGSVLILIGSMATAAACCMTDYRSDFDLEAGHITVDRRPTIGKHTQHVLPIADLIGPDSERQKDVLPHWVKRAGDRARINRRRYHEEHIDDMFHKDREPHFRVVLRMSQRAGGQKVPISPPMKIDRVNAVETKIRAFLPRRPNDND